jgi:CRISPR/Cas system CMR subunit Cmr4 (Cas7 group RAMP superfamily)
MSVMTEAMPVMVPSSAINGVLAMITSTTVPSFAGIEVS